LSVAEGPFDFGAQAFYTVDDNISRAQNDADIEEDGFYTVSGNAAYTTGFGRLTALIFSAVATVEEYSDFDGLSNTQFKGTVDYRFQFNQAFSASRWSLSVSSTDIDSETDIRDGGLNELSLTFSKRLTDRINGTLGVTAGERRAEGRVFDMKRTRYFGNVDWNLSPRWSTYLTYNYFDGDVVSSARPNIGVISWADAIEPDNAFGGLANSKFAYRLDASTTIIRLGFNVALGHSSSIDFSFDDLETDAAGPNYYNAGFYTLGYLYHF
jgi:hypothetical protein